ncbi:MAG TPA: prolyl oligopeptidase family serine peptidase [Polyangiales bacterium]|nr:prolyl oligopeptidase family serine peptidase [Polyangiales bacterium]
MPNAALPGSAVNGGAAEPQQDLFVTRTPASSVPVVVQKPIPPATMAPAQMTPPGAPAGGIPGAPGGIPGAPGGVPGAPGGVPGAPGAPGGAPMMPATMVTIEKATGGEPMLPAMMGECPEFRDGTTIMVAGHKGVNIRAGAPGMGGPILFYWHGTGSSAAESIMFPGNSEIVAAGGIVAAFNGSQSSGTGMDCSGTGAHNMADFNAADQIVACGVANHKTDSRRIYSTGCSAGGLQTGCMAMVRSSYIAAVAPNSGGLTFPLGWQDMHTPAVFTMHGAMGQDVVIVDFSNTSQTFDMSAKQHGGFVVNCNHMGGHCGAPANLQQAAWKFMKDHPWNAPSPWMSGIPAGVPEYCKIF